MKSRLLIIFMAFALSCFGQTNSFVTELYLANNFTPKSGITAGSNNTLWMDCDQITSRYNVTISGVTTAGLRLPSQNQLTASGGGSLATVTTTSPTFQYYTDVVSGGSVTSDGGYTVTARGTCVSTSHNPTILNSSFVTNGTGIGNFVSNWEVLDCNTIYYIRAYATNSQGTSYGAEYSFSFPPGSGVTKSLYFYVSSVQCGSHGITEASTLSDAQAVCYLIKNEQSCGIAGTGLDRIICTGLSIGDKAYGNKAYNSCLRYVTNAYRVVYDNGNFYVIHFDDHGVIDYRELCP